MSSFVSLDVVGVLEVVNFICACNMFMCLMGHVPYSLFVRLTNPLSMFGCHAPVNKCQGLDKLTVLKMFVLIVYEVSMFIAEAIE